MLILQLNSVNVRHDDGVRQRVEDCRRRMRQNRIIQKSARGQTENEVQVARAMEAVREAAEAGRIR
jgi:hypothetical protein